MKMEEEKYKKTRHGTDKKKRNRYDDMCTCVCVFSFDFIMYELKNIHPYDCIFEVAWFHQQIDKCI
jgi:hypothetical protein